MCLLVYRAQQKEIADLKVKANLSKEELSSLSVRMQEYQGAFLYTNTRKELNIRHQTSC